MMYFFKFVLVCTILVLASCTQSVSKEDDYVEVIVGSKEIEERFEIELKAAKLFFIKQDGNYYIKPSDGEKVIDMLNDISASLYGEQVIFTPNPEIKDELLNRMIDEKISYSQTVMDNDYALLIAKKDKVRVQELAGQITEARLLQELYKKNQ